MPVVLLTTDGSETATTALARGVAILGTQHRFVVLAVCPSQLLPAAVVGSADVNPMVGVADGIDPEETERAERTRADATLDSTIEVLGIEATPMVTIGDAASEICRVAGEIGADVIVVGSAGHGWLQRLLLGSVSAHVVRHAPCPVLVVRQPAEEAERVGDADVVELSGGAGADVVGTTIAGAPDAGMPAGSAVAGSATRSTDAGVATGAVGESAAR